MRTLTIQNSKSSSVGARNTIQNQQDDAERREVSQDPRSEHEFQGSESPSEMSPPLPLSLSPPPRVSPSPPLFPQCWLGLMIGNSRLHWALFADNTLHESWDTKHLTASDLEPLMGCWGVGKLPIEIFPPHLIAQWKSQGETVPNPQSPITNHLPIYLASVVPTQTLLWQTFPGVRVITLEQIPLKGIYPTLGIDRALALWGAGETLGWPILVIDAGTALTLTGADAGQRLVGGAILPGVKLQLQSLAQRTAA